MEDREKIRAFIEDNLTLDSEGAALADDDDYFALRFVNSLFAMRLVDFVECEFDIELENEDLDLKHFSTVNRLLALIERKSPARGGQV
ncbi:acyl carrier protein [Saccharibacillus sp. CPCC 101409]|uniref:acyl carrier protein n=1 Tax=Saccharibacillus sp. CPCC 101409 TaxID=3058041 RepID=UPI002672209E|nr:acyl carrier protein [Saccharibacillus sp. CPCC 101409]MDO3410492.1 acyl carrier protein [Saccharibacillus sp. CPCC 101409]